MRTMRRTSLALLMALAVSSSVFAQTNEPPVSLNASVGPSFGNVGTTFSTVGSLQFNVNDYMSLVGEAGILPRAPLHEAGVIAPPAAFADVDRTRVNSYHWNGNVKLQPFGVNPFTPYVTAGAGSFMADTVSPSRQVNGLWIEERRRAADFATNVGVGAVYQMSKWLGVGADYRTFFVHRDKDTPRVNRLTAGVTLSLK
jgi:hypothetical protein